MNRMKMIDKARRLSRTSSVVSNDDVADWLNEGMKAFCTDTIGIQATAKLDILQYEVDEVPQYSYAPLPAGFSRLLKLYVGITEVPQSDAHFFLPGSSDYDEAIEGIPEKCAVSGTSIMFDTIVPDGEVCTIFYERFPADLDEDESVPELLEENHMAVVYFAAAKLAEENFENDQSMKMLANYQNEVRKFNRARSHANPDIW